MNKHQIKLVLLVILSLVLTEYAWAYKFVSKEASSLLDPQDAFQTKFTPFDDGTTAYVAWFQSHKPTHVLVADYTFNNPAVAQVYLECQRSGGDVHILLDQSEASAVSTEKPLITEMQQAGIEIVIGTSPVKHQIMHNKFTVLDGQWVEDGSWNYTTKADQQANVLNFNTVASPKRGALFTDTWTKLHDFMKTQGYSLKNGKVLKKDQ